MGFFKEYIIIVNLFLTYSVPENRNVIVGSAWLYNSYIFPFEDVERGKITDVVALQHV